MAPLPENNTRRVFLDYTAGEVVHTLCFRFGPDPDLITIATHIAAFAVAAAPCMNVNDAFTGLRYQEAGTNFSVPVPWDPIEGLNTDPAWDDNPKLRYLGAFARSDTDARRVSWQFYTVAKLEDVPADNRYEMPSETDVQILWSAFKTLVDGVPTVERVRSISGTTLTLYNYLNTKESSYWLKQSRKAGGL